MERVAAFHHGSRALQQLTPPPLFVQLHDIQPLGENSKVDFTMWLGPLPVRWVAAHSNIDRLHGFTDTQVQGPFAHWVHRHEFRAIDEETTEILDEIQAEPGEHPFWGLVSWFMWLSLPILFAYRGWAVRRAVEKKPL